MSHVVSITPVTATQTTPGGTLDFDVKVSGVPADIVAHLSGTGSDGSKITEDITVDEPDLAAVLSGTPLGNQVLVTADQGSITVLGLQAPDTVRVRYVAP